jgi:hypothetical protein
MQREAAGRSIRWGGDFWMLLACCATLVVPASARGACHVHRSPAPRSQKTDVITHLKLTPTGAIRVGQVRIADSLFSCRRLVTAPPVAHPAGKLHPMARALFADTANDAKPTEMIITWRDPLKLPRFPVVRGRVPRPPTPILVLDSLRLKPSLIPGFNDSLKTIDSLIQAIRGRRAPQYERDSVSLAAHGVSVVHTYWLIRGALVRGSRGYLRSLVDSAEVVYIEPRHGWESPPDGSPPNTDTGDDIDQARKDIASDDYATNGFGVGGISLLDTGVRPTHEALSAPSPIGLLADCTNLDPSCTGSKPEDECDPGHGTMSAGILAGNGNREGGQKEAWKGVTSFRAGTSFKSATIHSFKVYSDVPPEIPMEPTPEEAARKAFEAALRAWLDQWFRSFPFGPWFPWPPIGPWLFPPEPATDLSTSTGGSTGACEMFADHDAAILGLQAAEALGDGVIVAEIQEQSSSSGAMSQETDHAYDTGHIVIAANGDYDEASPPPPGTLWEPPGHIASPANARKAIGVGAYCALRCSDQSTDADGDLATDGSQSIGPTGDGRFKPDLQAPTSTEASDNSGDQGYGEHVSTSGATPYAAAAAQLLWNSMSARSTEPVDPGQVHAALILATHRKATPPDNVRGAGLLRLPSGDFWFGSSNLATQTVWRVPIDLKDTAAAHLEAAIWWPEEFVPDGVGGAVPTHSEVHLRLISPAGNTLANAATPQGVFQRASHRVTSAQRAQWTIEVENATAAEPPVPGPPHEQIVYLAIWAH